MKFGVVSIAFVLIQLIAADVAAAESHWKTLKTNLGLVLEYPDSWTVRYDEEDGRAPVPGELPIMIAGPAKGGRVGGRHAYFSFECYRGCDPKETAVLTSKGLRSTMVGDGDRSFRYSNEHTILLGSEPADKINSLCIQEGDESFAWYIFVLYQKMGLMIAIGELGPGKKDIKSENDWKYKAEIEHMIASIRFTK